MALSEYEMRVFERRRSTHFCSVESLRIEWETEDERPPSGPEGAATLETIHVALDCPHLRPG